MYLESMIQLILLTPFRRFIVEVSLSFSLQLSLFNLSQKLPLYSNKESTKNNHIFRDRNMVKSKRSNLPIKVLFSSLDFYQSEIHFID